MSDEVFVEDQATPEEVARLRLVASRSLLSDRRRGSRRSLLVDSILAVLTQHGGRKEPYVRKAVEELWGTTTVTHTVFTQAVSEAQAAGLITRQPTLDDSEKLVATQLAIDEVGADRNWVASVTEAFGSESDIRLIGTEHEEVARRQVGAIVEHVINGIAEAASGSTANHFGDQPYMRPSRVDLVALEQYIRQVEDRRLHSAIQELAEAALDENDLFGNDIVHLIVAGNVIHQVVAQRHTSERPSLLGTHLLLDASVLVGLAADYSDPARLLIQETIGASVRLEADVCVGLQTVTEWSGLWHGADNEVGDHTSAAEFRIPRELHPLVSNPFVQHYVKYVEEGGRESWQRWGRDRRDLRGLVAPLGVTVLKDEAIDPAEITRFKSRIEAERDRRRRKRETRAIEADARSCAMIETWRAAGDTAYFVSTDQLTPVAYSAVTGDQLSLTVDPRPWALYVTNLLTDDPDRTIQIADLVSRVSIRNAIFGLAAAYPLEDILEFVDIIHAEGVTVTAEEVRDLSFRQMSMLDDLDALEVEADSDVAARGADLARKLAARRIARADIERRRHDEAIKRLSDKVVSQDDESSRSAGKLEEAVLTSERLEGDISKMKKESADGRRRRQRRGRIWTIAAVAAFVLLSLGLAGWLGLHGGAVGTLGLAFWVTRGLRWADNLQATSRNLLLDIVEIAAIEGLALLVGTQVG